MHIFALIKQTTVAVMHAIDWVWKRRFGEPERRFLVLRRNDKFNQCMAHVFRDFKGNNDLLFYR